MKELKIIFVSGHLGLVIFILISTLSFIIVVTVTNVDKVITKTETERFLGLGKQQRRLDIFDDVKSMIKPMEDNNVIYFHNNQNEFIETLSGCLESWKCSVLFHHLGKTGGSVLRDLMFDNYLPNEKIYKKIGYWDDWMNGNMTASFKDKKELYCRAKFSSYQNVVFQDIVQACRWIKPETLQLVALIPFRDPASRTLSVINHHCNKGNPYTQLKARREACTSCNYKQHQEFFNHFAYVTNNVFIKNQEDAIKIGTLSNVKVLMYDLEDMRELFLRLKMKLPKKKWYPIPKTNVGPTHICDFGINSKMMTLLKSSNDLYRRFLKSNLHVKVDKDEPLKM